MFANYIVHTLIMIGIYSILVASLNLAIGYTGILNLGHVAFFGIGAYTSAILTMHGFPFLIAFPASFGIAGLCGFFLMVITKRLQGDYVALATLGFSFVTYSLLLNWRSLTRGALGIAGIAKPNLFGLIFRSNEAYLLLVLVISVAIIFILYRITNSPYGKLLEAVRDDAIGLSVLGKNVFKLKCQSMMISAGCAGVAGALFAHYITYIHPTNFFISELILMISLVIVGGLASIKGSVAATALLLVITESLRFLPLPSGLVGPLRLIIYAFLVIIVLLYRPRGLFGRVDLE